MVVESSENGVSGHRLVWEFLDFRASVFIKFLQSEFICYGCHNKVPPSGNLHNGIHSFFFFWNIFYYPWLVWVSGLSMSLQTKGSPVWFPVRHMPGLWARSPTRGTWKAHTHWYFSPSFSPSFPLSKTNKTLKIIYIIFWLCYYSCPIFFSPLSPSFLYLLSHHHSLTLVHVRGSYI